MSVARPLAGLRLTSLAGLVRGRPVPAPPPDGAYPLPDGGPHHAVDLAWRAGHPEEVVRALVVTLRTLDAAVRREVLDPLGRRGDVAGRRRRLPVRAVSLGGARARQTDGTTCGSSVLALLAAAGDPVLALWLVTGLRPGELPGPGSTPEAAARFRTLQRVVKGRTNRRALGPFDWPEALGTPPWGAARVARYADVGYTDRVVADAVPDAAGAPVSPVVEAALTAASRGVPVPLFTGGDLGHGIATAVPRHVVLLTAADPVDPPVEDRGDGAEDTPGARRCWVYEPSSGTVHRLAARGLLTGETDAGVRRALGGWPHVCWALLPTGRAGERRGPAARWNQAPRTW
jgi:hypothetical protein